MSVRRPAPGAPSRATAQGEVAHSRRLDAVLRAGQAHKECNCRAPPAAPTPEPTGMLGPLLSHLPATLPGSSVPQPPSVPRPNFAPMPGRESDDRGNRAFNDVIPKVAPTKDQSVTNVMVNGEAHNGKYTGQLNKGKPDGEGTLTLEPVFSKQDRALKQAIERVAPLREAYLKVKAQHDKMADYKVVDPERAAQIAPGVEQQLRKVEAALHSARADVAALDPPYVPDSTKYVSSDGEATLLFGPDYLLDYRDYEELFRFWEGIDPRAIPAVVLLYPNQRAQEYEDFLRRWKSKWDKNVAPFASLTNKDAQNERLRPRIDGGLAGSPTGSEPFFTPGDLERYAEALKRGKVDVDYPEVPATTRQVTGSWYQGKLVAGEMRAEKPLKDGSTVRVSTLIEDNRPFGDTEHQVSLREETRNREDKLVHKIFAETTEKVVDWWGGVTLNLGGRMRWSARPTAHQFAWAAPMEQVVMRDGKGTLVVDPETETPGNPTLSGSAEVRLTVSATGKHVMLYGEMKDNKLLGLVKTYDALPDIDLPPGEDGARYFYVDGYDESGAPVIRRPTKPSLLGIRNTQPPRQRPPFDEDLDGKVDFQETESFGFWMATFFSILIATGLVKAKKDVDEEAKAARRHRDEVAAARYRLGFDR